ncbi:MAG: hypothetical protein PHY54_04015 [Methylococcales bacterium]|nr:hypothetical protein [Methylococcales bacterium]
MLLILNFLFVTSSCPAGSPVVPDAQKKPGDVLTADARSISVSGYTKTVRNAPQAIKEQVYRSFGITIRASKEYGADHLISLELDGSNSIKRGLQPSSESQVNLDSRPHSRPSITGSRLRIRDVKAI